MGTGYLMIHATTANEALPAANASVVVHGADGALLYETRTDGNGNTEKMAIEAVDAKYTLDPNYTRPAYSTCDVDVVKEGFVSEHIHGVEILDTQVCILPVNMHPLTDEADPVRDEDITIPMAGLLLPDGTQPGAPAALTGREVVIPDYITVHLGRPTDVSAANVRVRFPEYIKNVASSEIYSTWPQNSLVANIHAIVTFALNRVYTEWYRSRNFNFDITNSTAYDQYYRDGGPIYESISRIVDEMFNVYAHRFGFQNPFFTQFCNGSSVTCPGLSQWGTVYLAEQGLTPLEILRTYYPRDLVLSTSNNITGITESYPGYPLSLGSEGEPVRRMQNYLNRIRVNFPLIPVISNPNGVFGPDTQNAVRVFQSAFQLQEDGVIGRATWNKISFTFVGVSHLGELDSEGVRVSVGQQPPDVILREGSRGIDVLELQFILNVVAAYYDTVPPVLQDSIFGPIVKNAVIEFQKTFGLTPDGIVGPNTWNMLYDVYHGIEINVDVPEPPTAPVPYPGTPLRVGSTGSEVRLMQAYLNTIRTVYPAIPSLVVDAMFGVRTKAAVAAFQNMFGLDPDGIIGPLTWNEIVRQYQLAVRA